MKSYSIDGVQRPRTRAECIDGPRPCPWASCRHHLLLEIAYAKPRIDAQGNVRDTRPTTIRINRESPDGHVGRRPGLRAQAPAEVTRAFVRDAVEHLEAMPYTCALDVVDEHPDGLQLTEIGDLLGVTCESIRDASVTGNPEAAREGLIDFEHHEPADRRGNLARVMAPRPRAHL